MLSISKSNFFQLLRVNTNELKVPIRVASFSRCSILQLKVAKRMVIGTVFVNE